MQVYSMPLGSIGTNTYMAFDEETKKGFIVDPGGYSKNLTDKIMELGVNIEYIILTHGHADHIMGVEDFMNDFGDAKIIAAKAEKEMLESVPLNMSAQFGQAVTVEADIFVEDGDEMSVGNMDLQFFDTPGHTPGGMVIYVKNGATLFSGDTLFHTSIGRTDFPGGSFDALRESILNKIYVLPDETKVLPGHMSPTTIGFEKVNNPFVHL
ncbi:MAG: MBL fold metallo-hydrolase [Firmicutes bacterium]|nr:MBL fold metallo-hydrolase [Bacillota bacterium]